MFECPLNVIVRDESIEAHPDGSVTGVVFWNAGTQSFPDSDWNDMIVIVLGWWVKAVTRLLSGTSVSEEIYFMDGPYKLACATKDGILTCQFINRHDEERYIGSYVTTLDDLCSTVLNGAKVVLEVCRRQGIWNADVESLHEGARHLRKTMQKKGTQFRG